MPRLWGNWNPYTLLAGIPIGSIILESNLAKLVKLKMHMPRLAINCILKYIVYVQKET